VRGYLQSFGARGHDVDDLVQEVFLLLYAKRDELDRVRPLEPWLREVCRRVAAGELRRAYRRREVAFGEPLETADETDGSLGALELEEQQARLHRALAQLDEPSRDLVALHELGDLPLVDMAELVELDRKTVRKRLGTALRRLSALLGSEQATQLDRSELREHGPVAPGLPRVASEFRVLAQHPAVNIGLVGSVMLAVWPGAATVDAVDLFDAQFARASEICQGRFAFLAVVEASTRPPDLAARRKLIALLKDPRMALYAVALEGGAAWLARPIMTGLAFLARPPFPMQFFDGLPQALRWLVEKHQPVTLSDEATLLESIERLRR